MTPRIPVTVLSGYLGAGKTTLINQVLADPQGLRLAVVVNDFGPVNIDAGLIRSRTDQVVELSNGCVCCSVGDDLGETLAAIAAWPAPPDHLLLEASGVADPARIAMAAGHWPGFQRDVIVTVADAETIRTRAQDKFVAPLILSQLRNADIIALSKGDLLMPDDLAQTEDWLHALCPSTPRVPATHGNLPPGLLFGAAGCAPLPPGAPGHLPHFSTAVWRPAGPVDPRRLRAVLGDLPASVHRAKGVVTGPEGGLLVQCVGARCTLSAAPLPRDPCLVLICTDGSATLTALRARLDGCA